MNGRLRFHWAVSVKSYSDFDSSAMFVSWKALSVSTFSADCCRRAVASSITNRGEPALGREASRRDLVFGWIPDVSRP